MLKLPKQTEPYKHRKEEPPRAFLVSALAQKSSFLETCLRTCNKGNIAAFFANAIAVALPMPRCFRKQVNANEKTYPVKRQSRTLLIQMDSPTLMQ